ncbi:MAG: hypothetical protein JWM57_3360 [Phycisphaerales bacterium]|nr:hypothetical protein [Phycisphaerales bacterium]
MFFESLDARRLMAATGLDPTFANDGSLTLKSPLTPNGAFAAGGGATFMAVDNGTLHYVAKLDAAGQLDPTFGSAGLARVGFKVSQLAYLNGTIYAGGTTPATAALGETLNVTRLRPTGKIDQAFGSAGTFSFASALPSGTAPTAKVSVDKINVLADGSAVVAIDRTTAATDTDPNFVHRDTDQNLALIKLRPDGTKDTRYGMRGISVLLTGTVRHTFPSALVEINADRGYFADVQTNRHGVTSVLIQKQTGTGSELNDAYDDNEEYDAVGVGRFDVKARTISAKGVVDPATAYSWKLLDSTGDDSTYYRVPYVGYQGGSLRATVAEIGKSTSATYFYTLQPGARPTRQAIDTHIAGDVAQFIPSIKGTYFAVGFKRITRLNSDFTIDSSFGVNGLARTDSSDLGFFADDSGRLLGAYGGIVRRFV